jgi:hypothetical protein
VYLRVHSDPARGTFAAANRLTSRKNHYSEATRIRLPQSSKSVNPVFAEVTLKIVIPIPGTSSPRKRGGPTYRMTFARAAGKSHLIPSEAWSTDIPAPMVVEIEIFFR